MIQHVLWRLWAAILIGEPPIRKMKPCSDRPWVRHFAECLEHVLDDVQRFVSRTELVLGKVFLSAVADAENPTPPLPVTGGEGLVSRRAWLQGVQFFRRQPFALGEHLVDGLKSSASLFDQVWTGLRQPQDQLNQAVRVADHLKRTGDRDRFYGEFQGLGDR